MHDALMNWQKCNCTVQQTTTGNGCLYCNPERAYYIAHEQAEKERREKDGPAD